MRFQTTERSQKRVQTSREMILMIMIFQWYSIILSILRDWKTIMKKVDSEYYANTDDNDTCIVFKEQLMSIGTIRTKEFYDLLISKIFKQPSSHKTIARKLNAEIVIVIGRKSIPSRGKLHMTRIQEYFKTRGSSL